ncbi:hypothetical protein [Hamadaea tsunoensis]|uniref:hypothetical protein n=1 Tax=Hamadaea tsunoensis TaxID=53368 RepID=UPI0004174798|nr:hypothetical protein [Hamadaea tsunoensis]
MIPVLAVGAVGHAIAAKLTAESYDVAVILTDAVTADVEQLAWRCLSAGTPVLITVLTGARLTVGPLHLPDGPGVPSTGSGAGAPAGVLTQHIELAAEVTRWYLRHAHTEALSVDLVGVGLRRSSGEP